jgi:hypothetical protein
MPGPVLVAGAAAAIATALRVMLMAKLGTIVLSCLAFFGMTWGINKWAVAPAIAALEGYVDQLGAGGGAAATALQWAGVLQFDSAISVLISAYTIKWTIVSARVWLSRVI